MDDIPSRAERQRKRRRPRRILGLWARLSLLALGVVALALAIVGLITKAVKPYRERNAQQAQIAQTRRQIAIYDEQNAALKRRIAYLKTPEGMTREARKMGYTKPGEVPLVVEGSAPPADTGQTPVSPAPAPRPSAHARGRRWWRRLMGH